MKVFLDASICLNLLDTTRPTSSRSVSWYMRHKDDSYLHFFFSGDFITAFYYVLSERRKIDKQKVVTAIDVLCFEIQPFYINHNDFLEAKDTLGSYALEDFEDLLILYSARRCGYDTFCNESYMDELLIQYEGTLFKNREDLQRLVSGGYISDEEIGKRPLSKLIKDISIELGLV